MRTIHTILTEDVGLLDRTFVRSELMSERGVSDVSFGKDRNSLLVEYDPAIIDNLKLAYIMRRYGVVPVATPPSERGDGRD